MKCISATDKVVSRPRLLEIAGEWRRDGLTIVFTNGVFDILHRGHLASLEAASQYADRLVVGVNSDASAKMLGKGDDRPINREQDRAALIAGIAAVDLVVVFEELTPWELLSELKPDTLAKGGDYRIEEIVGREFAGRVERIEIVPGLSTTNIVEKIRKS